MRHRESNRGWDDDNVPHAKFFEKALTAAGEWTRFADPKLLGVLVLLGLGVSNIVARAGPLWDAHKDASFWGWAATSAFVVSAVIAVLVVLFVSRGLFPRTTPQADAGTSLFFFAGIATFKTPEEYEQKVRSKTAEQLESEVARQAWEVSTVAVEKHACTKLAYHFVIAFLVAWVVARLALSFVG